MQINGTLILLYFIEMLPRTVSVVGAPSYGKSWIRHCYVCKKFKSGWKNTFMPFIIYFKLPKW